MTNEEKIKEIVENQPFAFFNDNYQAMIAWGAEKMAQWKDAQFKEYLEKKREELFNTNCLSVLPYIEFIDEIIKEFFGE